MSDFSIKPELRIDRPNEDGRCVVRIRVIAAGDKSYRALDKVTKVPPAAWCNKTWIKASWPHATVYNKRIRDKIKAIEDELLSLEGAGMDITREIARTAGRFIKIRLTLQQYGDIILEALKKQGLANKKQDETTFQALSTWKIYYYAHRRLIKFAGDKMTFGHINHKWLNDLKVNQLIKHSWNTACNDFKWLRKLCLNALEEKKIPRNPLEGFKVPAYRDGGSEYLTLGECELIEKQMYKTDTALIRRVCAFFLLECYSGLRHSDWGRWSIEKLGEKELALKVREMKKTGKPVYLPLKFFPRLSRIVRYIQKHRLQCVGMSRANESIKIIAGLAGISKKLTTHSGRHTAATLLLDRGLSREAIAEILGVKIKQVDTYAKPTQNKVRLEIERHGGL